MDGVSISLIIVAFLAISRMRRMRSDGWVETYTIVWRYLPSI